MALEYDDLSPIAIKQENQENEEDQDDELNDGGVLDWRKLTPFIPKKGEKDLAPMANSNMASQQAAQLEEARNALFDALSAGTRFHTSKAHNIAVWRPELDAASIESERVYGIHFNSIGHYNSDLKRFMLSPEETLYLLDRGAIECYQVSKQDPQLQLPMSVQEAYATVFESGSISLHQYQVYANLKRLGFTLMRSKQTDTVSKSRERRSNPSTSIIQRCMTNIFKVLHSLTRYIIPQCCKSNLILNGRTLLTQSWWSGYDQIFSSLRIIPSGHVDSLTKQSTEEFKLRPFFDVFKPVTKFRKKDPPPPDFRLLIVNSKTDPFPSKKDIDGLFNQIPPDTTIPISTRSKSKAKSKQQKRQQNDEQQKSIYQRIVSFFVPDKDTTRQHNATKPRQVAYNELKNGKKPVVIAIVDSGTINYVSIAQADFAKFPFMGGDQADPK